MCYELLNKLKNYILYSKKTTIFNVIILLITVIVFSFIVFSVYKISRYNLIEHDDFDILYSLSCNTFFNKYFVNAYKAKILSNFLIIFSGYDLPKMLNYNFTAWIQSGGAIIKGFFWGILCIILTSTVFLFNKKNLLFPTILLFTYIYLQLHFVKQFQNELYSSFYCFTFPFIFYILFWNKFIKIYVNNSNNTKKDNILLFVYGILTGLSSEITAIATFSSIIILFFINIINKNTSMKLFKYSLISTLIGNCIYFLSPGFINNAKVYGTFISFKQTIDNAIIIFPEYISGYKDTFFNYFLNYLIVIGMLAIIILRFNENKLRKKMSLITFSLLTGAFFFFTLLLFAGKPMNHTAVVHYDIIAQMIILFVYIIYFQLNCLFSNKIIFYSIIAIILSALIFQNYDRIKLYINNKDYIYNNLTCCNIEKYRENYIYELILSYYSYMNKPAIINKIFGYESNNHIYNYIVLYNKNYNKNNKITFVKSPEIALKEYYNNGGRLITQEELNNPDIQKLKNKDFVLYGE